MFATPDSRDRMRISIRKARPDDATHIRQIALESKIDAWTVDQYREETGRTDAVFYTACEDEVINGFISGRVVPGATEGRDGEIYNIAVSPQLRGKGIGRVLLENAVKRFASERCNSLWLEVRESNRSAIQFYENNGFKEVNIRRNFYTSPVENAIVMKLTLVREP